MKEGGVVHALIARSVSGGRVETLVNIQNGPALESLAALLVDDQALNAVFKEMDWQDTKKSIPGYFELLFSVEIAGREVPRRRTVPKLIAHRLEKRASARS